MKPTGEMTEKNLLITAKIFWPNGEWGSQKRFAYDPVIKENIIWSIVTQIK